MDQIHGKADVAEADTEPGHGKREPRNQKSCEDQHGRNSPIQQAAIPGYVQECGRVNQRSKQ